MRHIVKPGRGSTMRAAAMLTLMLLATGCARVAINDAAVCDGTAEARTTHAAALAVDAGPQSLATGARLVDMLDAGCGLT